jgi:hypothetical protein
MMFGLGGAARGYSPFAVIPAALFYNVLADEGEAFDPTDGLGAVPGWGIGWGIGVSRLFLIEALFCNVANTNIGRDNVDQIAGCQACSSPYLGEYTSPGSINRVSGLGDSEHNTITELQDKINNFIDEFVDKLMSP